jgi:acyl carrier protein
MLRSELASFIQKTLVSQDQQVTIDDHTALIEDGLIDSMGLMQIVAFLDERAGVRVPDDEVTPENFETIAAIDQLVERLQARRASR